MLRCSTRQCSRVGARVETRGSRRPRVAGVGGCLAAALLLSVLAAIVVPPQAAAASPVRLHVTAPVREQEPLARVHVRARVTDAGGRGVAGVRCLFTWRQGGEVLYRRASRTAASGRVSDARVAARAEPGRAVRVTVRCRLRGGVRTASTWFVPQPPLPASPRIVFIGDSLTRGLYASAEDSCFRALVGAAVPSTAGVLVSSNGRSDGVDPADVAAAGADICVIELGTNDASGAPTGVPASPDELARNLRAVVKAARSSNPACRIVFLTTWQYRARRAVYDPVIVGVAAGAGRHVVDLSALKDDPGCSGPRGVTTPWGASDAWHPNDTGHAQIAARVGKLVVRLLRLSGVEPEPQGAGDIIGASIVP